MNPLNRVTIVTTLGGRRVEISHDYPYRFQIVDIATGEYVSCLEYKHDNFTNSNVPIEEFAQKMWDAFVQCNLTFP